MIGTKRFREKVHKEKIQKEKHQIDLNRRRFSDWRDFCTKFEPLNDFLNCELYIILKCRSLEIEDHSSFFKIIDEMLFLEIPKFKNYQIVTIDYN